MSAVDTKIKKNPYGVSDFERIRSQNCYYVDKTRFIRDIEEKGYFLFFIRPRRFGKSLFLSLLKAYYDINYKDRFDELFKGTDIYKNPTPEKNSYMVLSLNFSKVGADTTRLEESFISHVENRCRVFIEDYSHILGTDKEKIEQNLSSKKSASDILETLLSFCEGKSRNVYIIIDEYDNFANTILTTSGERDYLDITRGEGFLRNFFNVVKGGTTGLGAPVSRLFMTGVSPITIDDVTSGFNIGDNICLDEDINEILGFTGQEITGIIEHYRQTGKITHSTAELMDIMSSWYNNYRFSPEGGCDLFNPVQVFHFIKEYLKSSKIPRDMIDRNFRIDYHKLRHLITLDQAGTVRTNGNFSILTEILEKGEIHSTIEKGFPIKDLTDPVNFVSLLYFFGMLTIRGIDDEGDIIFNIPNETVKRLYYDYFKEIYEEAHGFTLEMRKYLDLSKGLAFRGEWRPLFRYLGERIDAAMRIRDLIKGEKAVQVFLNVYLGLSDYFLVHPEKELNKGFADIVLEPDRNKHPAPKYTYLIEIKYMKSTDSEIKKETIDQLKQQAEEQLNRYANDETFKKSMGSAQLIKIVLIFSGHRLVYMG